MSEQSEPTNELFRIDDAYARPSETEASTADILRLFHDLHDAGRTIVLITHEHDIAAAAGRIVTIFDGTVATDASLERVAG